MHPLARRLRAIALFDGGLPIVWIALTWIVMYPVWHQRLLPMLDSPNHLALARGWHDFHDPASRIAEFYDLRVRVVPYFLFYGTINLLLYVVPIEIANKLFLSAYLILFPLAVLALAQSLRRDRWLALFGFVFVFNQNWIYGFASYLMSVTFALFAMASLFAYLDTRRLVWALTLGVSCIVCYLGHIMPWVLFGLCAIGILVVNFRRWQAGIVAAVVMLPSVTLAVTAILDEQHEHTYIKDAAFAGTFHDFHSCVWEFPGRVMDLFPGHFDYVLLGVVSATLAGIYIWEANTKRVAPDPMRRSVKLVVWVLALAYVGLPYSIGKPMAWWYVAPRIPSLIMVILAVLPTVRFVGLQRLVMLPVVICAVAMPIKLGRLYRVFSSRNMPAMKLIEETPRGATTLVVVRNMMRGAGSEEKSGDPATSGPVYWHFSSWPMALRDGYNPYLFDQGIPLRPKHPLTAPPWGSTDQFNFRSAPQFEYYLVRDATEEMDREPSVKLQHRILDWSLYHREHAITDEP